MEKFSLPTNEYYFGKNSIQALNDIIKKYKTVLLLYGGGSIKKNGVYQSVVEICKSNKKKLVEFGGISPNPTNTQVNQAGLFARKNKVDLIIAAGGGSVVDASKIIASICANPTINNGWDLILESKKMTKTPTDIVSIITLAGTASENNGGSVITNEITKQKWAAFTRAPIVAIEDPEYTYSVSKYQTACGIFDCFSHLMEQYFVQNYGDDFEFTNAYIISLMKTLIKYAPIALNDPQNYDARANILITTSFALNDLASFNMKTADWDVHDIEHSISGIWNVAHGAGLALVTPTHLKLRAEKLIYQDRMKRLGKELFGVNNWKKFIKQLEKFISLLQLPKKYSDFTEIKEVTPEHIKQLVSLLRRTEKNHAEKVFLSIPK